MTNDYSNPAIVLKLCINGLGVARCLGSYGIKVVGISQDPDLPGNHSRYVSENWKTNGNEEGIINLLLRQRQTFSTPPVLFPITDAQVLALANNYNELKDNYLIGLPSEPELVRRCISKKGFHKMTEQLQLPAPQTFFIEHPEEIERAAANMIYPCIIKPEFRSPAFARVAKQKALLCQEPESLITFYRSFCQADSRAVIQQWIPGGDEDIYFCLQYYSRTSRPLISMVGRKIRQWPPLSGGTASCIPVKNQALEELTTSFFSRISFHGLCSMEFKRNTVDGKFVMIEPTIGRTDWQSDVATINNFPIPYVAYCDLAGYTPQIISTSEKRNKWVRWSADKESAKFYRKQNKLGWWSWLWSIRPPCRWSVWRLNDPYPYIRSLMRKILKKIKKILHLNKQGQVRGGDL